MARGVDFKGANTRLLAPAGDEDRVSSIFAFRNGNVVVTCWELTDEEISEILRTKRIFVGQLSGSTIHPTLVGGADCLREACLDHGSTFPKQENA